MNLDDMPKKKKMLIITLILLPELISISFIIYLKIAWYGEIVPGSGEYGSPVENVPLFTGLILFTFGYLFFLGMLFSDNIIGLFNKRQGLNHRR